MKISVVICTRDRAETIGQAVESVAQCNFPSFDIHIMDQSTNDATRILIEGLATRYSSTVAICYHLLDKPGLSRAYNIGATVTDGEVIAYTDDDVIVPTDWLTQIADAFAADPDAGLLYGQVLVPVALKAEVSKGIIVPSLTWNTPERLIKGRGFKVFGMGANMAVRRTLLADVSGFDQALGGGGPLRSSQDFDFAYRTYLAGRAILLEPKVQVDHYGMRTQEQWPATLKNYGIGDGAFYAKHIRCGDLYALRMLTQRYLRARLKEIVAFVRTQRWSPDLYGRYLLVGIREARPFRIDKKFRLYQESALAKMTVTQSNIVTAAVRGGNESGTNGDLT